MQNDMVRSSIEYTANGKPSSVSFSHPNVPDKRAAAIRGYLDAGCELLVDLDHLPAWAKDIPPEAQTAALDAKPELFQYVKLRVSRMVALSTEAWSRLPQLEELRSLSISSAILTPDDLAHALPLSHLETLVLHSPAVTDSFCGAFPRMDQLRSLDVIGTPVTAFGVKGLRKACPNARIYSDTGV